MRKDLVVLIVVVLAVGIMITAAVRMARKDTAQFNAGGGSTSPADLRGAMAPDFELKSLDGQPVKLSSLRGKAVLLNFWATWCQPCKLEMPWFEELHKQYAGQGLEVVGVAMDDASVADIRKFARDDVKVSYTILIGKEAVGQAYGGVQFLPTTFYIDRNGKVLDRVFGIVSRKEIEDNIKKALAVGPGNQAASAAPTAQPAAATR
ncbi:MAG TPA: TlpA disulfide reductase family protein [Terriglobales bacterium]|nr:TlpA disulfide reductase family protein [Terriglobales bacterium]